MPLPIIWALIAVAGAYTTAKATDVALEKKEKNYAEKLNEYQRTLRVEIENINDAANSLKTELTGYINEAQSFLDKHHKNGRRFNPQNNADSEHLILIARQCVAMTDNLEILADLSGERKMNRMHAMGSVHLHKTGHPYLAAAASAANSVMKISEAREKGKKLEIQANEIKNRAGSSTADANALREVLMHTFNEPRTMRDNALKSGNHLLAVALNETLIHAIEVARGG